MNVLGPIAILTAALAVAGCGAASDHGGTTSTTPARAASAPPATPFVGESAGVEDAVAGLRRAIGDRDVRRLCRPGAIFTRAVIDQRREDVLDCEAWVEQRLESGTVAAPTLATVSLQGDLAVARLDVAGHAVPLTLLRDGRRWLISFSRDVDPLETLAI